MTEFEKQILVRFDALIAELHDQTTAAKELHAQYVRMHEDQMSRVMWPDQTPKEK